MAILEARGDLAGLARLELARAETCQEPSTRAAALLAASSLLERSGDAEAAREAAERARDADPDDAGAFLALSRLARAAGDVDGAARALLAVAIRSDGLASANAALEAATLLSDSGRPEQADRALMAAVAVVPGSPAARRALADRARETGDVRAVARHLSALDTTGLAPEELQAHRRALARALSEAGDPGAEAAWLAVFESDSFDAEAFDRVAALARGRGDAESWLALAARHEGALAGGSDVERRRDLRCERAALLTDLGRLDAAEGSWQAALALDPRHRRALRGLRALLERREDHERAVETLAVEASTAEDPIEQAELLLDEARLRQEKLGDQARAASALDAAVERLRGLRGEHAERLRGRVEAIRTEMAPATSTVPAEPPTRALETALARAREALFDGEALVELASTAGAAARTASTEKASRLEVLARAASDLASFAAGDVPRARTASAAVAVGRQARHAAAHPMVRSPLARLLALLAPYLERLFPADLSRCGVSGQHRLGTRRAPELLAVLEEAQRAMRTRAFAAFLADTGGCEVAVENTQPPSLVLGAGLARSNEAERRFLLARGLALVDLGWALAGKFAPRDVAILCELACRFGGGAPATAGLPPEQARPFLEALERVVPPIVRERAVALVPEATRDLAALAPRELTAALRQSASRLALLHTGDLPSALAGLVAGERRLQGLAREQVLAHPDVRDLAAFALSSAYAALRAAAGRAA